MLGVPIYFLQQMGWTVISFDGENTVEAVPSSWISNNLCLWPPFSGDKLQAAIRKQETPSRNWQSFKVTLFKNSNYGKKS